MSDGPTDGKPPAPLMIGVSGLRGIVGERLTPEVAMRFAGAFGAWLGGMKTVEDIDRPDVVVACDGRANGPAIYEAAIEGLLRSGCNVKAAGVQMTPTIGCAISDYNAHGDAGLIVTASHNPQEWNGLKLLHDGAAPDASSAAEIIELYKTGQDFEAPRRGTRQESTSTVELHLVDVGDELKNRLRFAGDRSFKVVVDSVNSSGVAIVERFFDRELPAELHQLHGDNSGVFPHTPEPTAENLSGEGGLCDAVPGLKADIGFAQDPDGDRLAIVDETGRYIGEEYTLALCAVSILEAHKNAPPSPKGELSPKVTEGVSSGSEGTPSDPAGAGPPPPSATGEDVVMCANLSTSRMIDDIAARYGASVVRTAVGEANVVEAMKRLKREGKAVLLGGEGNGGVIWPEVTYVRDSLGSMALVLSLMARTGKTVSQLVADIPSYAIVKRKQPLANKSDAQPAIKRIAGHYAHERVDNQDGVRVDFDAKKAWVHVRASNTEPILRLIGEAHDEATANAILDEVAKLVEG